MVGELDSRPSGLGSSPDRGHCVVFLGWVKRHWVKRHFPLVSLHPGVQLGIGGFNLGGNSAMD